MFSAIIILALWVAIYDKIKIQESSNNSRSNIQAWALSLSIAEGIIFTIGFIEINAINLFWSQVITTALIIVSIFFLALSINKKDGIRLLAAPFQGQSLSNRIVLIVGICSLVSFGILIAAQQNGDSNTYNLARLPTMIAANSTILDSTTANARQAIYTTGHDLIYFSDLVLGNTRGLSLVCTLEFIGIIGVSISICKLLLENSFKSTKNQRQRLRLSSLAYSLLILMLFGSHMQTMQALITKNDLVITFLFVLSLDLTLSNFRSTDEKNGRAQWMNISIQIYLSIFAIAAKTYGLIVILPLIFNSIFMLVRFSKNSFFGKDTTKSRYTNNGFCAILAGTMSVLILTITTIQSYEVEKIWSSDERYLAATDGWTNLHGSVVQRAENTVLNSQRILFQGILFPLTSLRPYTPLGPKLNSPVNDAAIPDWLQGSKGIATGSVSKSGGFELLSATNPDIAYPLLFTQLGILTGIGLWLIQTPLKQKYAGLTIISCCTSALIIISTAILYQTWISRFVGTIYIPLIPLGAVGLASSTLRFNRSINRKLSQVKHFAFIPLSLLPLLSSISLSGYLNKKYGMPQVNTGYYKQHLIIERGFDPSQAEAWIKELKDEKANKVTFCGNESSWTMVPMLLSQNYFDHKSKKHTRVLLNANCKEENKKLSSATPGTITRSSNKAYIWLP